MIIWRNEAEAIGYAESRLTDAADALRPYELDAPLSVDGMALALEALADAVAALVLVRHTRKGDALVTIDQLATDLHGTTAAQPPRTCCQTYLAELHARGCVMADQLSGSRQ